MKIIPLNIMMSYPIKWNKQQVLRDIVQNFYDDAGFRSFGSSFKKEYIPDKDSGTLVLTTNGNGFSYEWLLHIGASTKQDESGKYAGFFGEGFKMAALCALRDYNWKIIMRSKRWSVEVCTMDTVIDDKTIKQLAYNVEDDLEDSHETVLTMYPFSQEDFELLNIVVLGFYYPENPLLGKLIFENEYAAIYERSEMEKPNHFAFSFGVSGNGIIFIGFQARAAFVEPIVICNHRFKTSDRERNNIFFGTVLDIMLDLVDLIDVEASCYLLKKLEKYWYDFPRKKNDMESWYSLIRKLIRKIAYQGYFSSAVDDFVALYPDLAVCDRPSDRNSKNRRTQALVWRKLYLPDSRLVQDSFKLFGYKNIETLCEEANGFNITRTASDGERRLLKVLEDAAKIVLKGFVIDFAECHIIENDSSVYNGTARLIKNTKPIINKSGIKIRYSLKNIEIKKSLLKKDNFIKAFSTYCHELCHCFGGDSSVSFSLALTEVISLTLAHMEILQMFNKKWIEIFSNEETI